MIGGAVEGLRACRGVEIEAVSRLYQTTPWGDADQGAFLNAAVAIRTSHEPHALLDAVKAIEDDLGRYATRRWGPRVIDIDIVHMEGVALTDERLTLPHRHWRERAFVLVPLAEIAPDLVIDRVAVSTALAVCDRTGITRRDEEWTT